MDLCSMYMCVESAIESVSYCELLYKTAFRRPQLWAPNRWHRGGQVRKTLSERVAPGFLGGFGGGWGIPGRLGEVSGESGEPLGAA